MFHTLIEKLNPDPIYYNIVAPRLLRYFVRICQFLPCPTCAEDAGRFLANISYENCNNKTSFKNTFYLFHNYVNRKNKKPLFNYESIDNYKNYELKNVVNHFLMVYNTRGNMQLLTQSFHRDLLIKEFKKWLQFYLKGFLTYDQNSILNTIVPIVKIEEQEPVTETVTEPIVKIEEQEPVTETVTDPIVKIEEQEPVTETVTEPIVKIEQVFNSASEYELQLAPVLEQEQETHFSLSPKIMHPLSPIKHKNGKNKNKNNKNKKS